MHSIFNFFKYFLFAFLLITFSASVYSGDVYEQDEQLSDEALECGITSNNVVHPASGKICAEDTSFRIFYKLFPDVFESIIFEIIDEGTLSEIEELEQENLEINRGYQYALIYGIHSMVELSFFLLGFFVFFYALMGLLKTMESGEALGQDWSVTNVVKKYGFIAVLLVPLGNGFVLGQMFIFILIMIAIYLANFVWSGYLSFMEMGDDPINVTAFAERNQSEEESKNEFITELVEEGGHISKNASYITERMIDIGLCKNRTERRLIDHNASQIQKHGFEEFTQCIIKDTQNAQIIDYETTNGFNFVNKDSFFSYRITPIAMSPSSFKNKTIGPGGGTKSFERMMKGNEVQFGAYNQFDSVCQNFEFGTDYECGAAKGTNLSINSEESKELIEEINFKERYNSVVSQFSSNVDIEGSYDLISQGWSDIYDALLDVVTDSFTEKMRPEEEEYIKTISYLYHQMIYYDLMLGNVNVASNNLVIGQGQQLELEPYASSFLLSDRFAALEPVVDNVMDVYCSKHQDIRKRSERMKGQIEAGQPISGETTSSCLDISRDGQVELYGEYIEEGDDFSSNLEVVVEDAKEAADINYELVNDELVSLISAVEFSFYDSLKPLSTNSLIHSLRREGWFMLGGYMFHLSSRKDIEHKYLQSLRNSLGFNMQFHNKGFVAPIDAPFAPTPINEKGDKNNFRNLVKTKDKLIPERDESYSPNMRASTFINNYATERMQGVTDSYDREGFWGRLDIFHNPFSEFKYAIGMSKDQDLDIEGLRECFNDEDKRCPIPLENPLIGLSNFGNQLIDISATIMATSIATSMISKMAQKLKKSGAGEMSEGASAQNSEFLGKVQKSLSGLFNIMEIVVTYLVGFSALIMIVGIMFAYVLPLIPFVAFSIAAISWIVFCLQVLFLFPLWCVFSMRLTSQQDTNSDMYKATYNLVMQVLLKPVVLVSVYVLLWSFLGVMIGIMNLSIVPYILGLTETQGFFLTEFVSAVVVMLLYAILLYIIVRMAFKTLHTFIKKIFSYLKVDTSSDINNQQSPEDMLQNAMTGGIVAGYAQNVSSSMQRAAQKERSERKSEYEPETVAKAQNALRNKNKGTNESDQQQ